MRPNPVFIAAPPRCGTSMMARVLRDHGFWIGRTKTKDGAENLDIKNIMWNFAKRVSYKNWKTPLPMPEFSPNVLRTNVDIILNKEKVEDNWLVKTSWTLIFYIDWMLAYPNAIWLLLQRSVDNIVGSMLRHPVMRKNHSVNEMRAFTEALQERQNMVFAEARHTYFVDMDKFVSDLSYSEKIINYCTNANIEIIANHVDKNKWKT